MTDDRPKTRGDCIHGPRPCPWVSCRYHLLIEVSPSLDLSVWERMTDTCALDVADRGPNTLGECGQAIMRSRSRAEQIEKKAMASLRDAVEDHHALAEMVGLDDEEEEET